MTVPSGRDVLGVAALIVLTGIYSSVQVLIAGALIALILRACPRI